MLSNGLNDNGGDDESGDDNDGDSGDGDDDDGYKVTVVTRVMLVEVLTIMLGN